MRVHPVEYILIAAIVIVGAIVASSPFAASLGGSYSLARHEAGQIYIDDRGLTWSDCQSVIMRPHGAFLTCEAE